MIKDYSIAKILIKAEDEKTSRTSSNLFLCNQKGSAIHFLFLKACHGDRLQELTARLHRPPLTYFSGFFWSVLLALSTMDMKMVSCVS